MSLCTMLHMLSFIVFIVIQLILLSFSYFPPHPDLPRKYYKYVVQSWMYLSLIINVLPVYSPPDLHPNVVSGPNPLPVELPNFQYS